jgi:hypothetical protein
MRKGGKGVLGLRFRNLGSWILDLCSWYLVLEFDPSGTKYQELRTKTIPHTQVLSPFLLSSSFHFSVGSFAFRFRPIG